MQIYQRYIIHNIFNAFVVICFVIISVVWITQVLKLLYLIDLGIGLGHFLQLVVLIIPWLLFIILPLVTICATLYTYNHLTGSRQLLLLRSFGLSNTQLAIPAIIFSIAVTLLSYYVSAELMPQSYTTLKAQLRELRGQYFMRGINAKSFNQLSKFVTIYVNKKLPNSNKVDGIILFDNNDINNPVVVFAKTGQLILSGHKAILYLEKGIRQAYDANSNLVKLHFDTLMVELLDKNKSQQLARGNRDINEYYIAELLHPPKNLESKQRHKLIAESNQRIVWPLYNIILTMLGLAIFLWQPYNKKSQAKKILVSTIGVIIVTYLHFTIQNRIAQNLSFIYYSYINIICAIIVSLWLYKPQHP